MLYEEELQSALTQEDYIKTRWKQAFEILALLPDERRSIGYKPSLPAPIRSYDEDYWKEWGQSQSYRPSPREIELSMEAVEWAHYAGNKAKPGEKEMVVGIIALISRGCGVRQAAILVGKKTRRKLGRETCRKRFNQAVADVVRGVMGD